MPLRHAGNERFPPRLSSDLGGVWLFRIHCQEAAALRLSRLGCVTFFVYVLGLSSSPLGGPKVPLRHAGNERFPPRLSSDLGGVWLFRIHCQEAAALRLSRLGCVTFFVYVLGLSSSPLGGPKVPLRHAGNERFPPRLSSDLGGVSLFRIHCQEAAPLRLSRLGCVTFFVYVLGLSSSPLGGPKVPLRHAGNERFPPRLSSLPRGCRFAFVRARLRHVFCLRTGAFFFSFRGMPLRHAGNEAAAALRLSRLGCVTFFVYVLGLSSSPLGGPKVPLRHAGNERFPPRLSSDLGGVWLFRIHCQEAAALRLSRLGCVTFFVYVLGLSSSPLGGPKVPLRCRFAFVQARLRHVFCLRTGAFFFSFRGSKGATSARWE